jgi:hypothetical protein
MVTAVGYQTAGNASSVMVEPTAVEKLKAPLQVSVLPATTVQKGLI